MRPGDGSPEYPQGSGSIGTVAELETYLIKCRTCPRLVKFREAAAQNPPRQFANDKYWARPVPGFGDPAAKILVAGLAPSANGSNRTGRMFTGDKSGDFLFAGLYRAGFANQASATERGDGLTLTGIYLTAPVHCAPPDNKPTAAEMTNCRPYLTRELELISPKVIITLGGLGWNAILQTLATLGNIVPTPKPKFGHGTETTIGPTTLIGCYHPSPQNTNTGRLTPAMLDEVLARAIQLSRD